MGKQSFELRTPQPDTDDDAFLRAAINTPLNKLVQRLKPVISEGENSPEGLSPEFHKIESTRSSQEIDEEVKKNIFLSELATYGRKIVDKGRGDQDVWLVDFPHRNTNPNLQFKDTTLAKVLGHARQEAFKTVGEEVQNGGNPDIDRFDETAAQFIITNKEGGVVGGYRIWRTHEELQTKEVDDAVYNAQFFESSPEFTEKVLNRSIETGRSFIRRDRTAVFALHNTFTAWHRLCTEEVEKDNSNLRILFGGVSISDNIPQDLQEKLVYFLQEIIAAQVPESQIRAKDPELTFTISEENQKNHREFFTEISIEENLTKLKNEFKKQNINFPTLFDSYIGLGKPGAIRFGVAVRNPKRGNCIEIFMMVDLKNLADDIEKRFGDPEGVALRDKIKK